MCGISGIFAPDGAPTIREEAIRQMTRTLRHRGPDDEGIFVAPGIGIGHNRLSIIDIAGGHQPISNEDESVWVILNGEIYNYTELRSWLTSRGHQFRTNSDTESIVHLYEEVGEKCFELLRGMFAIAIWDARERRLVLARDRIGKKPLFYGRHNGQFLFGSELKALLALKDFPRTVDAEALSDYWSLGYIPSPKTIYRAARKVRPAHYLVVSNSGIRESCYWKLSFRANEGEDEEQWCEEILNTLEEATRIRLMSDVPLGAFLSGGVDSSAVVAMMARTSKSPVKTCSIGFEEEAFNEAAYARDLAMKLGTNHIERTVQPNAIDVIQKLAWHYDEPFADSSAIPTYYVSCAARESVTVALGGDGGDENFAGYPRYYSDTFDNRFRRGLPPRFRAAVFGPLGKLYPPMPWAPRVLRGKYRFQSIAQGPLEGYFASNSVFRPHEKSRILSDDFQASLADYDSLTVMEHHYDEADTDDPLSRIQYVDIKTYLPDDVLVKVDRASMATSLEVRAPLLDHKFMELAASIPSRLKLAGSSGKYIFKKALSSILPRETLERQKHGFGVPVCEWFRGELRQFAYDAIFQNKNDDCLNSSYLEEIWRQHQSRQLDRSAQLWAVLMYMQWQRAFA